MSQDKHVLHFRSNLANNYPTHDKTLSGTPIMDYGEIAINYAAENEFISIKNSNNILTVFRAWPYIEKVILDNELVTASALTTLKESCGFNKNGKYVPSSTSTYISEATTVTEALDILDKNLAQTYTKDEVLVKLDNIDDRFIALETVIEDNEEVTAAALTVLNESCGFSEDAKFTPSTDATYISNTNSVTDALNVLDNSLSQTQNSATTALNAINYQSGYNTITTLSNIPQTKRSVLCSVSTDQTFYLNMNSTLMPDGQEIHVLVQNTNTTNNITVAYSTNATYVRMSGDSLTIKPSSWGEINVLRLGNTYYIRGL